jgi:hypothetical protein
MILSATIRSAMAAAAARIAPRSSVAMREQIRRLGLMAVSEGRFDDAVMLASFPLLGYASSSSILDSQRILG